MKYWLKILSIVCLPSPVAGQLKDTDSLRALESAKSDSAIFNINMDLSIYYEEMITDSSIYFADQALLIAQRNNHKQDAAVALNSKGYGLLTLGKYREALTCLLLAHKFLEKAGDENGQWYTDSRLLSLSVNHHMFGNLMTATKNTEQAIFHFREAVRIGEEIGDSFRINIGNECLVGEYIALGKFDSALIFAKGAQEISLPETKKKYGGWIFLDLGNIYLNLGNPTLARQKYYDGIMISA
jgi:tetratricopeptide (TPR) repeat protein